MQHFTLGFASDPEVLRKALPIMLKALGWSPDEKTAIQIVEFVREPWHHLLEFPDAPPPLSVMWDYRQLHLARMAEKIVVDLRERTIDLALSDETALKRTKAQWQMAA